LQPDGKIIIGGEFTKYNGTNCNNIARLLNDGTIANDGKLDITFFPGLGFNNNVVNPITYELGMVRDMVLDKTNPADLKLFVAGDFSAYNGVACDEVIKINCSATSGSKDNTFSMSGGGPNGPVWSMYNQGDGKIIIGGVFTDYNSISATNITRIFPTLLSNQQKSNIQNYDSEKEIDINSLDDLTIFPNPTSGKIIFFSESFKNDSFVVTVINLLGQKVFQTQNLSNTNNEIDLTGIGKGTYFVTFENDSKTITKKIIIN
jgi:hypothetical protein